MSIRDDHYAIINRREDRMNLIRNRRVTIPSVRCLPRRSGWIEILERLPLAGISRAVRRAIIDDAHWWLSRKKELTAVFVALATLANADIICRVLCPLLRASNNTIFIFGRRVNVSPMHRAILLVPIFFVPLLSLGWPVSLALLSDLVWRPLPCLDHFPYEWNIHYDEPPSSTSSLSVVVAVVV